MKLTVDAIELFLRAVDLHFPTPLSKKQDLHAFALKLFEKATLCCKFDEGKISAMVAGYTDNLDENIAYISIVATRSEYRGRGYAASLVTDFIEICARKNIDAVHLYSACSNIAAMNMYRKLGFVEYIAKDEPRPDDAHLIFYVRKK